MAVWGRNDEIFLKAGTEALKRDCGDLVLEFLDAGHFAVETHGEEIAEAILRFKEKFAL